MSEKLSWISVVNEEAEWQGRADLLNWLSAKSGARLNPSERTAGQFAQTLKEMRNAVSALHFDEELRLDWLNERLEATQFVLGYEDFLPICWQEFLPLLHARVKGASDDAIMQALSDTILLQFSQFVADSLIDGQANNIARCQGVFRASASTPGARRAVPLDESELRWRQEIDLLKDNQLTTTPEIERCSDLFIAAPKARFCSDACRFATFQLTKHLSKPGYHAEKQKRYRTKQADRQKG